MLPIRDHNPSGKTPIITWVIVLINVGVFIVELSTSDLNQFIYQWALVPNLIDITSPLSLVRVITSMFLHAGLLHLVFNMWSLLIFGDNVESSLGTAKYILLYLVGGIIGGLAQFIIDPHSQIPAMGASGAIAAILGYYIIKFPHSQVDTLIFSWRLHLVRIPAQIILGFWFISQVLNGATTLLDSSIGAGIGWWAHIGGFLSGVIAAKITDNKHIKLTHVRY